MKNKKTFTLIVVIFVFGILFVALEKMHITNLIKLHPAPTPATQGPTAEQKKQEDSANAAAKKALIEKSSSTDTSKPSSTPSSENIELSALQEANNTVTVFTKLKDFSSGNCTLTVTNGGKTTTQTAAIYYQPEYSSCAGFSVPISAVGTGTWSITLAVDSGGASANKAISLGVK